MHDKLDISNILLAVIFSALGVIVPIIFHLLGLGSVFLPMYIPLAIGAFFLTGRNAAIMGIFTPLISALITGMPPFYPPLAFLMMFQMGIFCVLISSMFHRSGAGIVVTLITAIAADRLLLVGAYYIVVPWFGINFGLYTSYDLIKGFPGIVLMLIVVPVAVPRLKNIIEHHTLHLFEHKGKTTHEVHTDV